MTEENPWQGLDFNQCEQAVKRLTEYLSQELSSEEFKHVEKHLAECHGCHEMFSFEVQLLEIVREKASEGRAPDTLRQRILALAEKNHA
jgi:mycothiol system anti-sigma-R factor